MNYMKKLKIMTREERIELALNKGYTYDEVTGKVYSRYNKEINRKSKGYITINLYKDSIFYQLKAHQFGYFIKYGKIVDNIDHINGDKTDNRICNLREVTCKQNHHNRTNAKGYRLQNGRYTSQIKVDYKQIYLGSFDTKEEAREAYLDAKKIYHII